MNLRILLRIFLSFVDFQPFVAYKSVPYEKSVYNCGAFFIPLPLPMNQYTIFFIKKIVPNQQKFIPNPLDFLEQFKLPKLNQTFPPFLCKCLRNILYRLDLKLRIFCLQRSSIMGRGIRKSYLELQMVGDGGWGEGGGYPVKCGRLHKSLNSNLKNGQNSPKTTFKCSLGLILQEEG